MGKLDYLKLTTALNTKLPEVRGCVFFVFVAGAPPERAAQGAGEVSLVLCCVLRQVLGDREESRHLPRAGPAQRCPGPTRAAAGAETRP